MAYMVADYRVLRKSVHAEVILLRKFLSETGRSRPRPAPLDSSHLACAEAANADYLCTCDDRFLRDRQAIPR